MRLEYIRCENFFSHKHLEIDFTSVGSPVLITGENGSGKSSAIVEALTFAIFGQTRNPSVDQSIRDDETEMAVTVRFILSNQQVEITRRKKRDKTAKLNLIIDGIPVEELLTETQVKINKLFGLSYNSFLSSIILKQEDADFFVKQKPDERKKIIAEILDLNAFERIEKEARERKTELGREIKGDHAVLESLAVQDIDELITKLKTITKGVKGLETKAEKAQQALNEKIKWNAVVFAQVQEAQNVAQRNAKTQEVIRVGQRQLEQSKVALAEKSALENPGDCSKLKKSIVLMETELQTAELQLKIANSDFEKYTRKALDEIEPKKEAFIRKQSELEAELKSLRAQKARLEGIDGISECPTCLQAIESSKVKETYESLLAQCVSLSKGLQDLETPLGQIRKTIEEIRQGRTTEAHKILAEIQKFESTISKNRMLLMHDRKEYDQKIAAKQEYDLAQEKLQSLRQRIEDTDKHLKELASQIIPVPKVTLEEKPTADDETMLRTLQGQMQQALKLQSQLEAQIEHSRAEEKRREVLTVGLGTKIKLLTMYDKIVEAFSRKGIPASIIATVLPEIQAIANMYLGRMSQGGLHLEFKTTEVLKTGEERDTLDVNVYDGKNWRSFESFSGGEKFRISLSIRLALSKVLTRRAGVELELLILDEPAAPLDDTGKELFFETIMSLRGDFSKIIVMSHLPGLTDEFESRINLRKTIDGTKLVNAA